MQDDLWGFVQSINKLVGASFMQAWLSGQESEFDSHSESCGPDERSQKGAVGEEAKG